MEYTYEQIEAAIVDAQNSRNKAIDAIRTLTRVETYVVENEILEYANIAHKNYQTIQSLQGVRRQMKYDNQVSELDEILSKDD